MVKVDLLGKMDHIMKEILLMVISMVQENTILLIQTSTMKENLGKAIWKEEASKLGQMEDDMKEISKMGKRMEKGPLNGHQE